MGVPFSFSRRLKLGVHASEPRFVHRSILRWGRDIFGNVSCRTHSCRKEGVKDWAPDSAGPEGWDTARGLPESERDVGVP
jgi:hypothetical protein